MNSQTRLKRASDLFASPIDDEVVMFDTKKGKFYGLNEIATEIWNNLETPLTVHELCEVLIEEFEVSRQECLKSLLTFLPGLLDKGIIEKA